MGRSSRWAWAGFSPASTPPTGKLAWRNEELAKAACPSSITAMSPIVVDGMCIAHLGGKGKGRSLPSIWPPETRSGNGPATARPTPRPSLMTVEGTKQLVLQTEKSFVGHRGRPTESCFGKSPRRPRRRFYSSATPIVDGSTVIFTGQGTGTKAVKIEKSDDGFAAKELWSNDEARHGVQHAGAQGRPACSAFPTAATSSASNAKTGKTAWTDNDQAEIGSGRLSTPARSSWPCPPTPS